MTTYQTSIDPRTKKTFLENARKRGLSGSVVVRAFMQAYAKNPDGIDINEYIFDAAIHTPEVRSAARRLALVAKKCLS